MIEHARNPKSRKTLVRATALCLATATLAASAAQHGIDTADIDKGAQACTDFFAYANGT